MFIPKFVQAASRLLILLCNSCSELQSSANSSTYASRDIKLPSNITPQITWLIQSYCTKSSGEIVQPCLRPLRASNHFPNSPSQPLLSLYSSHTDFWLLSKVSRLFLTPPKLTWNSIKRFLKIYKDYIYILSTFTERLYQLSLIQQELLLAFPI